MKSNDSFNHLNNAYKEIAEELGIDAAKQFHKNFKGLQISYPIRFLKQEYVIKQLKKEFNGSNLKQLALKYGYSERWVRVMLGKNSNDSLKRKGK